MQSQVFAPGQQQPHQQTIHQQIQYSQQQPIQTSTQPSPRFNTMQSVFFSAGSHIIIILSSVIFVVVTAMMSDGEFDRSVSLTLGLILLIYFFTSPIITFFSTFLVSFHNGKNGAAIIGSILGFILSIVLAGVFMILAAGGEFNEILEETPTSSGGEGSIVDFLPYILLQAVASCGAIFLNMIGRK